MDLQFFLEQTAGTTVVFGAAALAAMTLARNSAAAKHFVWVLAFAACLLLPVASQLKPPGLPSVVAVPVQATIGTATAESGATPPAERWRAGDLLAAVWFTGVALFGLRLTLGLTRSYRILRVSQAADIPAGRAGVRVRLSGRIAVPETLGFLRPAILLPEEARNWPATRLQAALAHESVHILRHDWLTQLMAQVAVCFYWFHPLAWFGLAQIRKERELACDDGVLALGYRNSDYAQHLVDVARSLRSDPDPLSPAVTMASESHLESRIKAILNPFRNRSGVSLGAKVSAIVCGVAAVVLLSSGARTLAAGAPLSGVVQDASGGVVPKASIVLTSVGSERKRTSATLSGQDGEWEIGSVEPGEYRIEIRKPGFRLYQETIKVEAGPARLRSTLSVGTLQETIEVVGETFRPPPARSTAPVRIRVGGEVQAAKLINMPTPVYPEHLKDAGVSGTVVIQAVISRDGAILNHLVLSPETHPDLVAAAVGAVSGWRYEPTRLNGETVEVVTTITVNFALSHK